MSPVLHHRLLLVFFAFNALLWLVWGAICLFKPESWAGQVIPGMEVFDLSSATARIEVRAVYGGLQLAIGLIALVALIKPEHRATTLLFFTLALSGLALSRMAGLWLEHSSEIFVFSVSGVTKETYNQIGLTMYEFPNFVIAWVLLLTRP